MDAEATPRTLWRLFEPLHIVSYFADEALAEFKAAGLQGFWMGYFAGRAAAMGAVGPAVVEATFFNFAPARVHRAVPDAWSFASPERVLEARLAGAERSLARILGPDHEGSDLERAAVLARRAAEGVPVAGRPLGAANAALPWPIEPVGVLWHAATILREHRGDGHVSALVTAGLDGCQALVSMAASGAVPRPLLQESRGWTDARWDEASAALLERGWLEPDGTLSAAGRTGRARIEAMTDELAAEPWDRLGADDTAALRALLLPLARTVAAGGGVPVPNPVGLPAPD